MRCFTLTSFSTHHRGRLGSVGWKSSRSLVFSSYRSATTTSTTAGNGFRLERTPTPSASPIVSPTKTADAVPCPYPIEGGHVPIYMVVNGIIQKRNWIFRNPEWCELCREPVALWPNHYGRKDHALLEQHYSALVEFPRRWNPESLLKRVREAFGEAFSMDTFHNYYRYDEQRNRNEIFAMLKTLRDGGMIYCGEPRHCFLWRLQGGLRGMDHQGALVMHELLIGPMLRLYPDGHIQDYSNLVDFITCAYNMETVYDLCNLIELDEVAKASNFKATSPAALGLGGATTSASASHGFRQDVISSSTAEGSGEAPKSAVSSDLADNEAFSRKAVFVRQILGQLRWLTLPGESVHPAGYTFPPHLITIGKIVVKAFMVEIAATRICEYMVRAEPIWREFGYERKKLDVEKTVKRPNDVLPRPIVYPYRPMAEDHTDLFTTTPCKLDEEMEAERGPDKRKGSSLSNVSCVPGKKVV